MAAVPRPSLRVPVEALAVLSLSLACRGSFHNEGDEATESAEAGESQVTGAETPTAGTTGESSTAEVGAGAEDDSESAEAETSGADDMAIELPEPVARWSFDGDLLDEFGPNQGTLVGDAAYEAGLDGQAIRLAPASWIEVHSISTAFTANLADFTVAGTVFIDDESVGHKLWCLGANVETEAPASNSFHILSNIEAFELFTETGLGDNHKAALGPPLSAGVWHRVAVSVNGLDATLFVDGQDLGTTAFQVPETASMVLTLGGAADPGSQSFSVVGLIDEIEFYDRSLTAAQGEILTAD